MTVVVVAVIVVVVEVEVTVEDEVVGAVVVVSSGLDAAGGGANTPCRCKNNKIIRKQQCSCILTCCRVEKDFK